MKEAKTSLPSASARAVPPGAYDEETRGLLRKIVEGQAYRQLTLIDIRGAGIKLLPEIGQKLALATTLSTSLRQLEDVEALYAALGFGDVLSAVRHKTDRIPFPATRMELAICLLLCERVSWHALSAYVDSRCVEFARIARTRLAELRPLAEPDDPAFAQFCADESHRPLAQQLLQRWLAIALRSLGRPNSPGDARAIELGLRSKPVARIATEYLEGLAPFLRSCGLSMPDAATLGLELPPPARMAR